MYKLEEKKIKIRIIRPIKTHWYYTLTLGIGGLLVYVLVGITKNIRYI